MEPLPGNNPDTALVAMSHMGPSDDNNAIKIHGHLNGPIAHRPVDQAGRDLEWIFWEGSKC